MRESERERATEDYRKNRKRGLTVLQIMNQRARLVTPGQTKVPWIPNTELRNAILAMRKLERKFERLQATSEKRIENYVAKLGGDPEIQKRRKEVMLEKANSITGARLVKKATKLQERIQKLQQYQITGMAA